MRDTFTAVREITRRVDVPVLVMTYWNPVLQYGVDRYADDLLAAGGAGLITPDITPEAAPEWIAASERTGLDRVFLAAPTSTDERLELIVAELHRLRVHRLDHGHHGRARRSWMPLPARSSPACATTASSTRASASASRTPIRCAGVLEYADGAIVGTALVRALREGGVERPRRDRAQPRRRHRAPRELDFCGRRVRRSLPHGSSKDTVLP